MSNFIIERGCDPLTLGPLLVRIHNASMAGVDPEVIAAACVGLNLRIGLETGIETMTEMGVDAEGVSALEFLRDKCEENLPQVYAQVGL